MSATEARSADLATILGTIRARALAVSFDEQTERETVAQGQAIVGLCDEAIATLGKHAVELEAIHKEMTEGFEAAYVAMWKAVRAKDLGGAINAADAVIMQFIGHDRAEELRDQIGRTSK
jgi:hypothetical protein